MTDRATSTVLDAALFLLLVGAAVTTLTLPTGPAPDQQGDGADDVADVLATSTADLQYTLAPGARHARSRVLEFPRTDGPQFERTAHGTLATHLATAALGNLTLRGQQLTHTTDDFERVVRNATRNATRTRTQQVRVRAVWEPYPDAPLRGEMAVGPTPPPTADVHAATLPVTSEMPAVHGPAQGVVAAGGNCSQLGAVVAEAVVAGLFPPETTERALLGDYPVAQLTTYRYERTGDLLGVNVTGPALADNATGANGELTARLSEMLATDLRQRYESPTAAASNVSVDTVRLTVRTWSP